MSPDIFWQRFYIHSKGRKKGGKSQGGEGKEKGKGKTETEKFTTIEVFSIVAIADGEQLKGKN